MSWEVSANEQFGAVCVLDAHTGALVADLTDCGGTFEEKLERARLIAQSNELLEAAESAVEDFWARHGSISQYHARWCDQFREEHPDHYIVLAERVIAQARGEA